MQICSIQQRAWLRILVSFRGFTDMGEVMFGTSNQWPVVMWGSLNKTRHLGGGLLLRDTHIKTITLHGLESWSHQISTSPILARIKQKLIRVNDGNAVHQFENQVMLRHVHDSETLPPINHKNLPHKIESHSFFTIKNRATRALSTFLLKVHARDRQTYKHSSDLSSMVLHIENLEATVRICNLPGSHFTALPPQLVFVGGKKNEKSKQDTPKSELSTAKSGANAGQVAMMMMMMMMM